MPQVSVEHVPSGEAWSVVAFYNDSGTISVLDQARDQVLLIIQPAEAVALAKMLMQSATEARDEITAALGE